MQDPNEAAFDTSDIGARRCGGTSGRADPPLQTADAVMA